jgi:hypothetical protein
LSPADELELRALCTQAFELRDTPYSVDAYTAIVVWWERRHLRALERKQARDIPALVRLIREMAL